MRIFMGLATQRHSQGTKEEEVHACQCITRDKNKMDGRGHYVARREMISSWTSYLCTLVLEHSPWLTMHSLANKNKQLPVSHGFKLLPGIPAVPGHSGEVNVMYPAYTQML